MSKTLTIICATQNKLNDRAIDLIRMLQKLRTFEKINIIVSNSSFVPVKLRPSIEVQDLSGYLFDFSRYYDGLRYANKQDVIFMFNDTLGNGRKLNLGLTIFIILSVFLIKNDLYEIASPVDKDQYGLWICPYFIVGKHHNLNKLNWINYEEALKKTSKPILKKCKVWVNENWRNAKTATIMQKEIKYKTLVLERNLIEEVLISRLFRFDRSNILRMLNAIISI